MEVRQTAAFREWLENLPDLIARRRIAIRIERIQAGLMGDAKSVGDGVSEFRIAYGPGYRLYFTRRGEVVVVLLCGGDKGSQKRDIVRASARSDRTESSDRREFAPDQGIGACSCRKSRSTFAEHA